MHKEYFFNGGPGHMDDPAVQQSYINVWLPGDDPPFWSTV